jgi:hypothetical protein
VPSQADLLAMPRHGDMRLGFDKRFFSACHEMDVQLWTILACPGRRTIAALDWPNSLMLT